jgi:uncharacterized protein (DUF58 family)
MIVPSNRLLFWVAIIVLPFATLAATVPHTLVWAALAIVILFGLAILDAGLGLGRVGALTLELPEVVRLSKDRPGTLDLIIRNPGMSPQVLRLGLPLPKEIEATHEEILIRLPAGVETSRVPWRCTPRTRGNYPLRQACLERPSPLGFWALRSQLPLRSELRVYPNLFKERKSLASLFLNRGVLGIHNQRQIGKGREFEKLREYSPGDSFDEIHWKATARRGHPITKVFQVERTQEVYVIVDASRLSARKSTRSAEAGLMDSGETLLERYITCALIMGLAAEKQGDLFGVLAFTNKIESFVRAKNGKAHYSACRDALYTIQPQRVTPDFDELASFIRLRLRRRALLIVLTSLDDPVLAESFVRNMELLCHQHLVLVNILKPVDAEPLFTASPVSSVDGIYQRLGGHMQWQGLRELEKNLKRRGTQFHLLENEKMALQLVEQYVGVKQRQLL